MASGAGAAGFGGGFASGLSGVLLKDRDSKAQKARDEEARRDRLFQTMLPIYLENVESPADLEGLFQDRFPDLMGGASTGKGKKGKAGSPSPFDTISHFLGPLIGKKGGMAAGAPQQQPDGITVTDTAGGAPDPMIWPAAGGELQPAAPGVVDPAAAALIGQPSVPSAAVTPAGAPAAAAVTPTATRRSLMGVPLMSEDEKIERDITKQAKVSTALMERARTTILPALRSVDPSATIQDALRVMGINIPRDYASSGAANQSIAGEMEDGTPAFGVFNRATGKYNDPDTGDPLPGFRPRTSTGSTSLGADRESLAKELFGKRASALTPAEMAQVNAKLPERAGVMSESRGLGTGRAKITTDLNAPIGPTAAALYNVPPTTTLGQLNQTNTLRPDQQEKVASLGQVDQLLDEIGEALPLVFPDVEPGVWGTLQTQFALGTKKLAADEDLATLDASINAALAQVAQLSGQPGSRLSDNDIKMAKSTLAELNPKIFGGDTLRTAQARLGVVRRLLEKARSSVPSRQAAAPAGAKPAVATATGTVGQPYKDAQGNWVIP